MSTHNGPKYTSKSERVRAAIRMKYISEDEWSNQDIAKELRVSEEVVSRYLNQTPQAEEVKKARSRIEEEQWKQLLTDLLKRIDKLAELEAQLWEVVEPAVTAYEMVPIDAEIDNFQLQEGGNSLSLEIAEDDTEEVRTEIPVPDKWDEIPQFSRLQSVWKERRRTEDQLNNLLGLDADENIQIGGEITERKVWAIDDEYPDAQPHPRGETPDTSDPEEKSAEEPTEEPDENTATEE